MEFELKDGLYILGIVISAIIAFLGTKYRLKEYIRDKYDELKDQINILKIELEKQKSKDDLQQQIIEQIGKQITDINLQLVGKLNSNNTKNERS